MTLRQFKESLSAKNPPEGCSACLQSLWFDAKGNWDKAHKIIQDIQDDEASWVHAYLHRKEGDTWNADYWYSRAGKKRPVITLEQEWESLVSAMVHR